METELRKEMARRIASHCAAEGLCATAVPGLFLYRQSAPCADFPVAYQASLCVVAQGEKQALLGGELYRYAAGQHLVVTVDLPLVCQVTRATLEAPYLCVQMGLDARLLAELLADETEDETGEARAAGKPPRAIFVGRTDPLLADGLLRLLRLLDSPRDIASLAAQMTREVCYRLLKGENGPCIARSVLSGGRTRRIAEVIEKLKRNLAQPMRVEDMADMAHMSSSSFHAHFKAVTAASPLQYHKRLRLLEARRLMLAEEADAEDAAFQVGYASASQFSREYARMFGAPPMTDALRLRAAAGLDRDRR